MEHYIDPVALESLIQKVADKHCSEADRNNFAMTGDIQVEQALKGQFTKEKSSVSDSDAFGIGEAKIAIEIASLIAGTVKAFWEIRKLRNASIISDETKKKAELWKEKLIAEGINPERAATIVEEFQNDISSLVA
jgi:hypothetical protein